MLSLWAANRERRAADGVATSSSFGGFDGFSGVERSVHPRPALRSSHEIKRNTGFGYVSPTDGTRISGDFDQAIRCTAPESAVEVPTNTCSICGSTCPNPVGRRITPLNWFQIRFYGYLQIAVRYGLLTTPMTPSVVARVASVIVRSPLLAVCPPADYRSPSPAHTAALFT